jgi:hypothetical protein
VIIKTIQEPLERLKPDFKKDLPTKDELWKKNYIGDAIIAERNDEDEDDSTSDTQNTHNNIAP